MGISLPLLAMYAFSAKQKGDRKREAVQAQAQAEEIKTKLENQTGNYIQLLDGRVTFVPDDGRPSALPEGSKVVAYGKRGEKIDAKSEPESVPVLRFRREDGTFKVGTKDQFTVQEEIIGLEPFGRYVNGKYEGPPVTAFGTQKETPYAPTDVNQIYATHPKAPKAYTGNAAGFNTWLKTNNIPANDASLTVYDQIVKNLKNGGTDITSSTLRNTKTDPVKIPDVRYTTTDESGQRVSVFASEGSINVAALLESGGVIEQGYLDENEKFVVTSSKVVNPGGNTNDLVKAVNAADYNILLRFGSENDNVIGVKESRSSDDPTLRLRGLLAQLSQPDNKGAIEKMNKNPNATDVLQFKDGVFGLMTEVWNQTDGDLPESLRTYKTYFSMSSLIQDQFQSLLLIPGMQEKVEIFDEGYRQKVREQVAEENTTATQGADATVDSVQVPSGTNMGGSQTVNLVQAVVWDKKYDKLINKVIRPYLEATLPRHNKDEKKSPEELALKALARDFIMYETDGRGNIIRDEDDNKVLAGDQPLLEYFQKLYVRNEFEDLTRLLDVSTSPSSTLNQPDQDLIIDFVEATDRDLQKATGLISALLPSNKGFQTQLGLRYNLQNPNEKNKYLAGQIAVRDASRRGLQIASQAIDTYYDPVTGELLDTSALAEVSLISEGVDYFVGRGKDLLGISGEEGSFNVTNFITNASYKLEEKANSINGETYIRDAEGRVALEKEYREAVKNEKYAQRAFFTLVLAYEVAAAIQGGTGGRTISDQDVALIFRGLRQNWTDSPQAQVSALRAVKNMLSRFEFRARMLASQDVRAGASYLMAETFFVRAGENMDGMFALPYVFEELGMKPPSSTGNAENFFGLSEEAYNQKLLNSINNTRLAQGYFLRNKRPKYNTIEEAEKDNPSFFRTQQERFNILLESKPL
jgi:hypothetical protein